MSGVACGMAHTASSAGDLRSRFERAVLRNAYVDSILDRVARSELPGACASGGCVTHYAYRGKRRNETIAVNAVSFEPSALVGVRVRHLDGASTWKFID